MTFSASDGKVSNARISMSLAMLERRAILAAFPSIPTFKLPRDPPSTISNRLSRSAPGPRPLISRALNSSTADGGYGNIALKLPLFSRAG
jgi:hypothetical protein